MLSVRHLSPLLLTLGMLLPSTAAANGSQLIHAGDRVAQSWSSHQHSKGNFPDYVKSRLGIKNRDTYSESMMGSAMLRWGLQRHNRRWVNSGVKALRWSFSHPSKAHSISRIFDDFAMVDGYAFAAPRLHGKHWRRFMRAWRLRLGRVSDIDPSLASSHRPYNQRLIEALLVFKITKLRGLRGAKGSLLSHKARATNNAKSFVLDMTQQYPADSGAPQIIGDAPSFPLAYHLLCSALLMHMRQIGLGKQIPGIAPLSDQANRTLEQIASPAGWFAHLGRSSYQLWTLGLTAYLGRSMRSSQGDLLADNALQLMLSKYSSPTWGFWLVPSLGQNFNTAIHSMDGYAAAVPYSGLNLLFLSWALAAPAYAPEPTDPVSSQDAMTIVSYPGNDMLQFATMRSTNTWLVLKGGSTLGNDIRQSPGIVSLEAKTNQGWQELLGGRPKRVKLELQQGPFLNDDPGGVGIPYYLSPKQYDSTTLALTGTYRTEQGENLKPRLRMFTSLVECGAEVRIEGVAERTVSMNLILPPDANTTNEQTSEWSRAILNTSIGHITQNIAGPENALESSTQVITLSSEAGQDLRFSIVAKTCSS